MTGNSWDHVKAGILVDSDIIALTEAGQLFTTEFSAASVKQACYELRASDIFYDTSAPASGRKITTGSAPYILRPHAYVTVIVLERIDLPADVVGRVLTKGQLFSIGILPVNTYADPGFVGRLGITLYNASHQHVSILPGKAIAKIEFEKLNKPVSRPYSGQHGYETEIWPVPDGFMATNQQLRTASIDPASVAEITRSYGPVVARLERRLRYYELKVWLHISISVAAFGVLIVLAKADKPIWAIGLGVVSNLVTALIFHLYAERST